MPPPSCSLDTTLKRRWPNMQIDHIDHVQTLTPVEARQGVISGRVRVVLVASLMLVVAAFAVIYVVGV